MSQNWLSLANEARKAASGLLAEERYRSCVPRTYYAAYSKVTHELVFSAQLTMPTGREGPSHARLRPLIETSMSKMNQKKREK